MMENGEGCDCRSTGQPKGGISDFCCTAPPNGYGSTGFPKLPSSLDCCCSVPLDDDDSEVTLAEASSKLFSRLFLTAILLTSYPPLSPHK